MTLPLSVAIPTYQRGAVLLDTLRSLLLLTSPATEILAIDQTEHPAGEVLSTLEGLARDGKIRWIRLAEPSIPRSMNRALLEAHSPIVLFLDDDIIPSQGLIQAHSACYSEADVWAVAGQVLQPGESEIDSPIRSGRPFATDLDFVFRQRQPAFVQNVMAGNLSVRRDKALAIGGFDENFVGVAYRFETDFAQRLVASGGRIRFEPTASIRHLRAPSGGTRKHGDHLRSASPAHSVGDYYFALCGRAQTGRWRYIARRMAREVRTRFHLTHPWWIAPKLLGEARGLALALRLRRAGRKLLDRAGTA